MSNVYSHVKPIVKICTKYELGDSAEIATHKHLKLYSGKRVWGGIHNFAYQIASLTITHQEKVFSASNAGNWVKHKSQKLNPLATTSRR